MVVLDSGLFSSFDCGQRMGAIFVATYLAQIAIVAGLSASVRRPSRYGPVVEMIDRPAFLMRRRVIVWAIWASIFAVVAATCGLLRTTTAVLLDSRSIIETSCTGPLPSEYRLDRAKLKITFGHDPTWLTKRLSPPIWRPRKSISPERLSSVFWDAPGRKSFSSSHPRRWPIIPAIGHISVSLAFAGVPLHWNH
ncbi:hypothetical protein GGE67_006140 [Rhizobium leucaenae]|uniref:Uncharacterized protein n=1 Tax=Rhizobium leucaenae TaxID=29450 RepID=A0A7W6ZZ16_9HYPH|nr:hypothetical protein [Rhizobium leucaenae]MBB6305471.1 hypothetical protein [Rhizobium leucaenae]